MVLEHMCPAATPQPRSGSMNLAGSFKARKNGDDIVVVASATSESGGGKGDAQASLTRRGNGLRAGFRALKDPAKFNRSLRDLRDAKPIRRYVNINTYPVSIVAT